MGHFLHQRQFDEPGVGSKGFFGNLATVRGQRPNPPPPFTGLWTARSALSGGLFGIAIATGNGTIVIQNNGATPVYSTNGGISWHAGATSVPIMNAGQSVMAFEHGHFSLTGGDLSSANHLAVWNSTDGITWTLGQLLETDNNPALCMVSNGTGVIFAGLGSTESGGNYFTSADHGLTWTAHNVLTGRGWGNVVTPLTCLWDGLQFVAVVRNISSAHCEIVSSSDGITWTVAADVGPSFNGSIAFLPVTPDNPANSYVLSLGNSSVLVAPDPASFGSASPQDLTPFGLTGNISCLLSDGLFIFAFDVNGNVVFSFDGGASWGNDGPLNFGSGDFPQFATYETLTQTPIVVAGIQSISGGGTGASVSTRSGPN